MTRCEGGRSTATEDSKADDDDIKSLDSEIRPNPR